MIIIAILMAVAIPTFLSQKSTARKTQLLTNIRMIQDALESCSAAGSDGLYTGCAEHDYLWAYDKSLKDLPICCPTSDRIAGAFDINGIDDDDTIVWVPSRTQQLQGYEIDTWMNDGDKKIWFQLAHWPDGTISKRCGEGDRPSSFDKAQLGGVPGSRICPKGSW